MGKGELHKVGPTWDESLELTQNWVSCGEVLVDLAQITHYFFSIMPYDEGSYGSMVHFHEGEGSSPGENDVQVRELVSRLNNAGNLLLFS